MKKKRVSNTTKRYERALESLGTERYVLHLYVAGASPASERAIDGIKALCERRLKGRYELKVVDIYQQPELAEGVQIVAVPTLVRLMPGPLRRFIGDMSKAEQLLLGLGVPPTG